VMVLEGKSFFLCESTKGFSGIQSNLPIRICFGLVI
jgi:hypothetical protein